MNHGNERGPWGSEPQPKIVDRCPTCGHASLFIGSGGFLTCAVLGCKAPGVGRAIEQLQQRAALLTFDALRAANLPRCVNDFGHALDGWSPAEWTNAMCGEAGEAANVAKKLLRHRDQVAGNRGEDTDVEALRAKLGRELADVVIYADLCAARMGLDLGRLVRETFNQKSEDIGSEVRL